VASRTLRIPAKIHAEMLAHAIAGFPNEACGLLVGSDRAPDALADCSDSTAVGSDSTAVGSDSTAEGSDSTARDQAPPGCGRGTDRDGGGIAGSGEGPADEGTVQDTQQDTQRDPQIQAAELTAFIPMANAAQSAEIYRFADKEYMRAERSVEEQSKTLIGVMHSHTRSTAYPSPTDVADAARFDPFGAWHFVIVSLKHPDTALRSFRILGSEITEEDVEVVGA